MRVNFLTEKAYSSSKSLTSSSGWSGFCRAGEKHTAVVAVGRADCATERRNLVVIPVIAIVCRVGVSGAEEEVSESAASGMGPGAVQLASHASCCTISTKAGPTVAVISGVGSRGTLRTLFANTARMNGTRRASFAQEIPAGFEHGLFDEQLSQSEKGFISTSLMGLQRAYFLILASLLILIIQEQCMLFIEISSMKSTHRRPKEPQGECRRGQHH